MLRTLDHQLILSYTFRKASRVAIEITVCSAHLHPWNCKIRISMREAKDEHEQKAIDDINTHGLHVVAVAEDDEGPGFAYSIGLFENYAHPEIIIVGLKTDLAHLLLNNMAFDIKEGKTMTAGEFHEGVLDDFLCYFGEVPQKHFRDYVGWARWFYEGDNFPLLQCVYPTVTGIYPWEKSFPEDTRWLCPLLTDPPKEH